MNMPIQITKKQSLVISQRIYASDFGVIMTGIFDLSLEQIAELMTILINSKTTKEADESLIKYYNYLLRIKTRGY